MLIHIEVQAQEDPTLEERMFTYYYRLRDRYRQKIAGLAILTDKNEKYKPNFYHDQIWETEASYRYEIIKILDYRERWAELEADPNPFAIIVMAQLKYLELNKDTEKLAWKLYLVRMLKRRGYAKEDVIQLFRLIDWMLKLPEKLELSFLEEIDKEEEKEMPYITSVERIGIKKGRQEGMLLLILKRLKRQFGELQVEIKQQLEKLTAEQLDALDDNMSDFKSINDLTNWLQAREQ